MSTLTTTVEYTLDGAEAFNIGQDAYRWDRGVLFYVETGGLDGLGLYKAIFKLTGSGWNIGMFRFVGDLQAVINDSAIGLGRSITNLLLETTAGAGPNFVTLANTLVGLLKGSDNAEVLKFGAAGAGQVLLRGGDDKVTTGDGAVDYLNLGDGHNRVTVGAGGVTTIRAERGNDRITALGGAIEYIDTGAGNDVIDTGRGWAGTVLAGVGEDRIVLGGGGAGLVQAGDDADTVVLSRLANPRVTVIVDGGSAASATGGRNSDTLVMTGFDRRIDIDLAVNDTVDTGYGKFLVRNFEHVSAGSGSDVLRGNADVNILRGNGGADVLVGRGGADDLYGGAGSDVFVFNALSDSRVLASGRDTIFDFTGVDRIDLRGIDANTKMAGNQAFDFVGAAAFSGKSGELRVVKQASDTYIHGDVNGDRQADFTIHLDDAVTLLKSYFLL